MATPAPHIALDLRGHGVSGGRSMSLPWKLDNDLDAALAWLGRRADVGGGRIGLLGVSLGGEISLLLAARRHDVRAVVAEGVGGDSYTDARTGGSALRPPGGGVIPHSARRRFRIYSASRGPGCRPPASAASEPDLHQISSLTSRMKTLTVCAGTP